MSDSKQDNSQTPPDLLAARAGANRPKGILDLPGVRKFLRNRMAVVASVVIGVYFLTALSIMLPPGLISDSAVKEQVGPGQVPGFGIRADIEQRENQAGRILEIVNTALRATDPQSELAAFSWAERKLFSTDPDVVQEKLAEIDDAFIEYDDAYADLQDALDELFELDGAEERPDAAEMERVRALVKDREAASDRALAGVEAKVKELAPVPGSLSYKLRLLLGTDVQGRSIFLRAVYSIMTAIQIGFVTSLIAVVFGGLLGAAAGFFGGAIDHFVVWLYSTVSAIPYLIWLIVIAFVVREMTWVVPIADKPIGQTLIPVYIAFVMTFWIGPCRVVRGEAMKIKSLDYIQSARSIGASPSRILLRHVVPNTAYLLFINMSLLFVGAIKAEVILSFLGLGVQGQPSWGIMIRDAKDEVINGFFWQIGAATAFMFVLVLAFNIVSDALQDAFDPKHVG